MLYTETNIMLYVHYPYLVAQSCLTFCDLMNCQPARLFCPWNSPGKNTGVGCHSLLQGIFLTQGSNMGLLQHTQILYCLRYISIKLVIHFLLLLSWNFQSSGFQYLKEQRIRSKKKKDLSWRKAEWLKNGLYLKFQGELRNKAEICRFLGLKDLQWGWGRVLTGGCEWGSGLWQKQLQFFVKPLLSKSSFRFTVRNKSWPAYQ